VPITPPAATDAFQRAVAFHRDGKIGEAIAAYQEAILLDESFHPAWYGQGCAWEANGEDASALVCFEKAVSIAPDHGESQHNLGKAFHKLGLTDEAISRFHTTISLGKGFLPRTAIASIIPGSPGANNLAILETRRDWSKTHLPPADRNKTFPNVPIRGRRLRVGYLSSFFQCRNWMKPVWGLLNQHDREQVEVHLFSDAPEAECLDCYRKHPADCFHDISGLSNQAAAEWIERSGLDILVDLNAYSRVDRLAVVALRPAPIVAGWFNHFATSGMDSFDYLIGDDEVIPREEEEFYTEKIVRIPGCYLTFGVQYAVPDVVDPPLLSAGVLTFGSLASQYKITPPVVDAWSYILRRSSGTRLFLKNSTLGSEANRNFLARRFEECGVPRHRITMEGPAEHFDFLAAYGRMDVALDTFPYNGGTTTSEAIWQGVPVLAFHGDRWAARQSSSILRSAGLHEFVAENVDDYIERAVALAESHDHARRLAELRRGMRSRLAGASICDTAAFARNMEHLYACLVAGG
jgi:protein O-GlcNAc transferase